jgi:hypothetical protein
MAKGRTGAPGAPWGRWVEGGSSDAATATHDQGGVSSASRWSMIRALDMDMSNLSNLSNDSGTLMHLIRVGLWG